MSSSDCPTTKVSSVVKCRTLRVVFTSPKNSNLAPLAIVPNDSQGSMLSRVFLSNFSNIVLDIKLVVHPVSTSICTGTRPTLPGRNQVGRWGLSSTLTSVGMGVVSVLDVSALAS